MLGFYVRDGRPLARHRNRRRRRRAVRRDPDRYAVDADLIITSGGKLRRSLRVVKDAFGSADYR